MKYNSDLSFERASELLTYSIVSGKIWWNPIKQIGRKKSNKRAGSIVNPAGRRQIEIDGKGYSANRVAWLLVTGAWPAHEVDHEDLNQGNDSWINLREATRSQNIANARKGRANSSGYKGVYWHKIMGKWCTSIRKDGVVEKLGYFDTAEAASIVYNKRARELFGEFARDS